MLAPYRGRAMCSSASDDSRRRIDRDPCSLPVDQAAERLEHIVRGRGMTVFARFDRAASALADITREVASGAPPSPAGQRRRNYATATTPDSMIRSSTVSSARP